MNEVCQLQLRISRGFCYGFLQVKHFYFVARIIPDSRYEMLLSLSTLELASDIPEVPRLTGDITSPGRWSLQWAFHIRLS
jgi:hypothetical protein